MVGSDVENLVENGCVEGIPKRIYSKTKLCEPPREPIRLRSALSSSNLNGMLGKRYDKDERTLRFSSTVRVLLIPSRIELLSRFDNVYWLHEDYVTFKREAVKEIKEMAQMLSVSARKAMTLLYQPQIDAPAASDDAMAIIYEEEQKQQEQEQEQQQNIEEAYDFYDHDDSAENEYSKQKVTIDYQFHCNNHPSAMARRDSNFLLEQQSPPSVTMASAKASEDVDFITNVKSDLELNENLKIETSDASSRTIRPRRTTTESPRKQYAWAIQWKKEST